LTLLILLIYLLAIKDKAITALNTTNITIMVVF